ncbi:hypothetical protein [Tuberibacillus sp. Marseille-P3662]|uniref:hypothetical protein n=1 Tax=Tuberibacillus sp. Marseille-P3662 TaxID=1965358 RepID=UPI0015931E04|nr:hypothetical protein [Tuberibacillus sp. Marseille-P3662]
MAELKDLDKQQLLAILKDAYRLGQNVKDLKAQDLIGNIEKRLTEFNFNKNPE